MDRPLRPAGPSVTAEAPVAGPGKARQATAPGGKKSLVLYGGLGLVLLAVAGGIGFYAWKTRVAPEQFAKGRPGAPTSATAGANAPKIESRAAGGTPAASDRPAEPAPVERPRVIGQAEPISPGAQPAPAGGQAAEPAQAGVAVAQRSAILIAAPTRENAQNVQTYIGTVVWRTDTVSRGSGQPLSQALRADLDIPDAKFSAVMTIEKNTDQTLPASHTITWRFQRGNDSPIPEIVETDTLQMRDETSPSVDPMAGARARITANIFIIALSAGEAASKRNLELLEKKGWFDLPVRTADNRVAKITLEKGTPGDKLLLEALARWAK